MDFEQLAFIERWRQKASRGVVVARDGTRGDIIVTMRVGEGAGRIDMRGQDATGAIRKQRLVRDWWSSNGMGSIVCLCPAVKVARATITGSSPL